MSFITIKSLGTIIIKFTFIMATAIYSMFYTSLPIDEGSLHKYFAISIKDSPLHIEDSI